MSNTEKTYPADAEDIRRYDREVEKFRQEVTRYCSQLKDVEMQGKNLLDGMLRLNAEVLKLHVRTGDVESKIGLQAEDGSDKMLKDIVRDLRKSHRGIKDSQQHLRITLPLLTPPGGISQKGILK